MRKGRDSKNIRQKRPSVSKLTLIEQISRLFSTNSNTDSIHKPVQFLEEIGEGRDSVIKYFRALSAIPAIKIGRICE